MNSILQLSLQEFRKCQSGATAIIIGIIFVVLVGAAAVVVDIARMYAVHSKAQNAADAALMGAVATLSTTDLNSEVMRLFNANYPTDYMGSVVKNINAVEVNPGVFELTFDIDLHTIMVQSVFTEKLQHMHILSQVTRGFDEHLSNSLELAIVMDNSRSMTGTKMASLIAASNELVDIIFGDQSTSAKIHMSVVPYETVVNIGPNHSAWVQDSDNNLSSSRKKYTDIVAISAILPGGSTGFAANRQRDHWCGPIPDYCRGADTCTGAGNKACGNPDAYDCSTHGTNCKCEAPGIDPETGLPTGSWCHDKCLCHPHGKDCTIMHPKVPGNIPWNTPGPGPTIYPYGGWSQAGCVPYVPVSSVGDLVTQGYDYNDINDCPPVDTGTMGGECPADIEKRRFRIPLEWDTNGWFANPLVWSWDSTKPWWANPLSTTFNYIDKLAPIMFGSNSKEEIHTAIGKMKIAGDTRINVGLMWGWFALSPKWQGAWDAAKANLPAPKSNRLDKAIVLMTDGKNVWIPGGQQTEWGPVGTTPPGTGDWFKTADWNDDVKTANLCAAIKAQGITIYTIGFGSGADINEDLLKGCASNDYYYFHAPTEEELHKVFHKIADDILFNTLRLSK